MRVLKWSFFQRAPVHSAQVQKQCVELPEGRKISKNVSSVVFITLIQPPENQFYRHLERNRIQVPVAALERPGFSPGVKMKVMKQT
jgi:hypothetical protein